MRQRALLLSVLFAATGATACTPDPPAEPPQNPTTTTTFSAVAPASIKATEVAPVALQGADLPQTAQVRINGVAPGQAGFDARWMDASRIDLTPQTVLRAGATRLELDTGSAVLGGHTLHVRPALMELVYLRDLPEVFAMSGGRTEFWVQPVDSERVVMLPGHGVAGEDGLTESEIGVSDVFLRHTETGSIVTPTLTQVVRVFVADRLLGEDVAFALAVDHSGSMRDNDPNDIRWDAARALVDSLDVGQEMALIEFHGNVNVEAPLTSNKALLHAKINEVAATNEDGGTAVWQAALEALDQLAFSAPNARRIAIVVTDGRNNRNRTPQEVIDRAAQVGAEVYTIGLGTPGSLRPDDLVTVSQATGADFYLANDAAVLPLIIRNLAAFPADAYRVETQMSFSPPLTEQGLYELSATITADVDGESHSTKAVSSMVFAW